MAVRRVERRYRPGTLVLETTFHTDDGVVRITDCMPVRGDALDLVRLVEGVSGRVPMRMHLTVRFDYGSIVPWVRRRPEGLAMVAGPDALLLRTPVELQGEDYSTVAEFTVAEGDARALRAASGTRRTTPPPDGRLGRPRHRGDRRGGGRTWSGRAPHDGPWAEAVRDSLVVLKGLTYAPTGGIVAAATTSLPEAHRRRPQLGLPLLLAARRHLHPARAHGRRLHRRGRGVAGLAAAGAGRPARPGADHVRARAASTG